MVVHEDSFVSEEPHYLVTAKVCEPDYKAEFTFLRAEMAFVERKIAEHRPKYLRWLKLPESGIFRREDWRKYHHALERYGNQLQEYAETVAEGRVLPVKFTIYNDYGRADRRVVVRVRVENGRVDEHKKPPARPERIDANGGAGLKLVWPKLTGFSRRDIKVTGHEVSAELSGLGAHDGATIVRPLLHVHCEPDTRVVYEIHSRNVPQETGDVYLSSSSTLSRKAS